MTGGCNLSINRDQVLLDPRITMANQFLNDQVAWQCLAGQGDANPVLWGRSQGRKLVLRLCAEEGLAFGADRNMEFEVLEAIRGYGWAPEVVHFSRQQGWCLMLHHGCSLDQFSGGQDLKEPLDYGQMLLQAVKEMQGINQVPLFNYTELFERYRRRFRRTGNRENLGQVNELAEWLEQLPKAPLTLVHHDLHQGNFCLNHGRLVILDWEYAGLGNPWLDMATLLRHHPLELEQIAGLPVCKDYRPEQVRSYLTVADKLNQQLESLWIAARQPAANNEL